jgi:hypothetical protein
VALLTAAALAGTEVFCTSSNGCNIPKINEISQKINDCPVEAEEHETAVRLATVDRGYVKET